MKFNFCFNGSELQEKTVANFAGQWNPDVVRPVAPSGQGERSSPRGWLRRPDRWCRRLDISPAIPMYIPMH